MYSPVTFVARGELTNLFSCLHAPYLWPQTRSPPVSATAAAPADAPPSAIALPAAKSSAVRGLCASGRAWKAVATKRASAMTRPKASNASGSRFRAQTALRRALAVSQSIEKEREDALNSKKEELKQKREETLHRKAENELKSASYQEVRHGCAACDRVLFSCADCLFRSLARCRAVFSALVRP